MSYITAIGTANPANRFSQSIIAEFMLRAMKLDNGDSRKLRAIFRASGIQFRHSVLDDYGKVKGFSFYPDTLDLSPFPGTEKRLHIFRKHALSLSVAAFHDMLNAYPGFDVNGITHVIAVCCTGMYAPGLDVELVNTLRLPSTVQRTAINFMGCHASFNALKVADALCRSNARAKVLIVCTELCSLHFQRMGTEDNLLANALFADGSAAVLVEGHTAKLPRLKLEDFHSDLAPEGESDMAWVIGDLGFQMRLSAYVPALIKKGVSPLIKVLLEKTSTELSAIQHYAIHPGGKRILEVIEEELGIDKRRNYAAYDILKNFGNMSSPTVLFVLNKIFRSLNGGNNGERVLSVAFGPGLTLESMILRVETPADHA
jgi:prepilin-type processing-associated H-X9-DG protein